MDIILKLNRRSDLLRKGSNWYPHRVLSNLEANKFTKGIMNSAKKMEQLLGRVITASGGMAFLFLCCKDLCILWDSVLLCPKGFDLGLVVNTKFLDMSCTKMEEED